MRENWRVEKDLAQCKLSLSDSNDISKAGERTFNWCLKAHEINKKIQNVENFNTWANNRVAVNLDVPRVESIGRTLSRGYGEQSLEISSRE